MASIIASLPASPVGSAESRTILTHRQLPEVARRECPNNADIRSVSEGGIYFALFIPGILGSVLLDDVDKPIWDGRSHPEAERLRFTGSAAERASVLRDYDATIATVEIYGSALDQLKKALGTQAKLGVFAYDWRQPIETSAAQLDAEIRGKYADALESRRLIVVAHSMGGLVAWTWKNRFFQTRRGEYPFDWVRLVLLGSPLQGSCEMLRMLIQGYQPIPGAGRLEASAYAWLFGDLRAAALTFPSVYELLPTLDSVTSEPSCLGTRSDSGPDQQVAPLGREAWTQMMPLVLRGKPGWLYGYDSVSDDLDLSDASLQELILRNVESANDFRRHLDLDEGALRGRVTYFYGNGHHTSHRVVVDLDNQEIEVRNNTAGDGRVMKASAINDGYRSDDAQIHSALSSHGALPADPAFMAYIGETVDDGAARVKAGEIARLLRSDSECREKLSRRYVIDPTTVTSGVIGDEDEDRARRRAAVAVNLDSHGGEDGFRYAVSVHERGDRSRAAILFESLLAEPSSKGASWELEAIDRYAGLMIEMNRREDADSALRRAAAVLRAAHEQNRLARDASAKKIWPNSLVRALYAKMDELERTEKATGEAEAKHS